MINFIKNYSFLLTKYIISINYIISPNNIKTKLIYSKSNPKLLLDKRIYSINSNNFLRDFPEYKQDANYKDYELLSSSIQKIITIIPLDINNLSSKDLYNLYNIKLIKTKTVKDYNISIPIQVSLISYNKFISNKIYSLKFNNTSYIIVNWYNSTSTSCWSIYLPWNENILITTFKDTYSINPKRIVYLTKSDILTFNYILKEDIELNQNDPSKYYLISISINNKWDSLSNNYITKASKAPKVDIATLDLETFTNTTRNEDNTNAIVYHIGYTYKDNYTSTDSILKNRYKSKIILDLNKYLSSTKLITKTYYLKDYIITNITSYESEHNIIIDCLKDLCLDCGSRSEESTLLENKHYHVYSKQRWQKTAVYVHNFEDFDSKFLLKHLLEHKLKQESLGKKSYLRCYPYIYDGNILTIRLSYNKKTVYLKDSIKLLTSSLLKLCQAFNLPSEISKDIFPYHFPNINNLNYKGICPTSSDFSSRLSSKDYANYLTKYQDNIWDLRKESTKYLELDLKSLWYIIDLFRYTTLNKYNVDITSVNTVAKLSIDILHKKFKGLKNIPSINKYKNDSFLRIALYGGLTSVYKPKGTNLYYYDVNSFYPHLASSELIPGLNYTIIKYNKPVKYDPQIHVGIWTALITTPKNDYLGLLPLRTSTYKGLNITTFPLGKFMGTWSHAELILAHKYKYNIEIIEGYKLEITTSSLKPYINKLYKERQLTTNKVENILYKLLLNSLLGRFAINTNKPQEKVSITTSHLLNELNKIDNPIFTQNILLKTDNFFINKDSNIIDTAIVTISPDFKSNYLDYQKYLNDKNLPNEKQKISSSITSIPGLLPRSVVITLYINSYGRVKLNNLLLKSQESQTQIYYCDTDSLVVDKPLPSKYIGSKLGQLKLEYNVKEGIFITNKIYCLELIDGTLKKAQRGTNSILNKEAYIEIYKGLEYNTTRSITTGSLTSGNVLIHDSNITINLNIYSHREKIYDNEQNWIDTKPLMISITSNSHIKVVPK